jgi:hypothetical protein
MGLSLVVGIIPDLYVADEEDDEEEEDLEEDLQELREEFVAINQVLRSLGLPEHHEPEQLPDGWEWDCRIGGYDCLHYLRRIAAHRAVGNGMPEPVVGELPEDPVFEQYNVRCRLLARSTIGGATEPVTLPMGTPLSLPVVIEGPGFEHLVWHSDCTGYYLPVSFPQVIVLPKDPRWDWRPCGPWLGSVPMLLRECEQLAEALQYPRSLHPEDIRRFTPDPTAPDWRRYAVEAFVCQALITACEASIRSGCALAFC